MTKNPFLRKCNDIKHNYGQLAVNYFKLNPVCENCGEQRIVCLAVHHVEGKQIDNFKILCANCHVLCHSIVNGEYTYKEYLKYINAKKEAAHRQFKKEKKLLNLIKAGNSIRKASKECGIQYACGWAIAKKYGVKSQHKSIMSR